MPFFRPKRLMPSAISYDATQNLGVLITFIMIGPGTTSWHNRQ